MQIGIKACSVNFPDLLMVQDKCQFKPPLPFAPGGEFAGDAIGAGKNVTSFKAGDRVVSGARYGGFAEAINVSAAMVKPIAGDVAYEKAASYATAYLSTYVALTIRGYLQASEALLVHGATGGVGRAAVDLGKHLRASVFDESMRCINFSGRLLTVGFTSGDWPPAKVNHILIKHISVIGVRAGEIGRRNPELGKRNMEALYDLLKTGAIDPYICADFPLEQAADAMKMLEDRKVVGKVVVTMSGYRKGEKAKRTNTMILKTMSNPAGIASDKFVVLSSPHGYANVC